MDLRFVSIACEKERDDALSAIVLSRHPVVEDEVVEKGANSPEDNAEGTHGAADTASLCARLLGTLTPSG